MYCQIKSVTYLATVNLCLNFCYPLLNIYSKTTYTYCSDCVTQPLRTDLSVDYEFG